MPDGTIPKDTVAQFDVTTNAMNARLHAAGCKPEHVVKRQVFMADISQCAAINRRQIEYFGEHRPASALVDPRMKVEIECQAAIPDGG